MSDRVGTPAPVSHDIPYLEDTIANIADIEPFLPRRDMTELYEPLDRSRMEIRILRLHRYGQIGGLIHCSLETTSLLDDPTYAAVSYAWGDPTETVELACDFAVVRVTKGLHSTLANLRTKLKTAEATLELWIDGLCINQNDLDERSSQVSIMDRHSGRRVYIQRGVALWMAAQQACGDCILA
ncbi:hypothetical protein AUP68_10977 [Ilyonectria robusta]